MPTPQSTVTSEFDATPGISRSRESIAEPASSRVIRADIQGLRALAVGLVVIYHLRPDRLTGGFIGVDVFFVISGFLITSHLVGMGRLNKAAVVRFWGNRIRRLLPASLVVLVVTLMASRLLMPPTRWQDLGVQAMASGLYVQNWALSAQSVDYLAAGNASTPFQHFWSLSLEEQFYLGWPVLLFAVGAISLRYGLPRLRLTRLLIVVIIVASLTVSVVLTASEPASAYFVTPARIWELAVGGAVAVLPSVSRTPGPAARTALAWVGLAGIVAAGITFDESVAFPGIAAGLPVLGTALVIMAAAGSRLSPARVLGVRPVQWLGGVSYSVYLWHWPLIVLYPAVFEGPLGAVDTGVIIASTLILAALTKRFVEDPYKASVNGLRPFRFALIGIVTVSALAGLLLAEVRVLERAESRGLAQAVESKTPCFGGAALAEGPEACPVQIEAAVVPAPNLAANDKPMAYADDCWNGPPFSDRRTCVYGSGPVQVALVGNSHAGQWLPALQRMSEQLGWTITTYLTSQCNASDAALAFDSPLKTRGCLEWGAWAQEQTTGGRYDLVITSQRQSLPLEGATEVTQGELAERGYGSYLQRWSADGTKVLIIRDTPDPGRTLRSVPDCVAANPGRWSVCSGTRQEWASADPLTAVADRLELPGVTTVDLTDVICDPVRCNGVTGGVVTYFDASHLTATYATTLTPYLQPAVEKALR